MAIASKQVAAGILTQNRYATGYVPVSLSSDWFESLVGTGGSLLHEANAMTVAVGIEEIQRYYTGSPIEELDLELFHSADLREWTHAATIALTATTTAVYSAELVYPGGIQKYLRIQFNLDLDSVPDPVPTIPYPNPPPGPYDLSYKGNCWVTVFHKRI